MLTEERHSIIIDTVNRKKNVELNELCELLDTSESTVRRDLSILHDKGVLVKVRGGASIIEDGDFVFIDAGTTTEKMIDFIPARQVTFVTNAFVHAKRLAQRGFKVFLPAGEIKLSTEAIIGASCVLSLDQYNFTKCFMGVNGISVTGGFSTPDPNEASVKAAVINNSHTAYILADHSKFDKTSSVKFPLYLRSWEFLQKRLALWQVLREPRLNRVSRRRA